MASSRKRKPLADLTNEQNLIPVAVLRKLVAARSNPSSVTKPPDSNLKSSFRTQVSCSGSENTSIGSENISATRGSKTVGFRTPDKGHVGLKDQVHHTREVVKSYKDTGAASLNDVLSLEKRKDKGKEIVTPASLPYSTSMNVKESTVPVPIGVLEKEKKTPELYPSPFHGPELGDGITNTTDRGKTILIDSSCSIQETEGIGKATEENSIFSIEKTYDRKKRLKPSGSSIKKSRTTAKETLISPTSLVDKTKVKEKAIPHAPGTEIGKKILISSPLLVEKTKEKGKAILHCPPSSNKTEKLNSYDLTASCPAIPRTKKDLSSDLSEGGSSKSSKSWTGPRTRKKNGSRLGGHSELPLDFLQQQKAYYEEVDAFELPVEEASDDESD